MNGPMWERSAPAFNFVARVVMSPEDFESLKTVSSRPEAMALMAYEIGKALIERDGRTYWHAVDRQYQFGQPVYFARPIVVRVHRPEPA